MKKSVLFCSLLLISVISIVSAFQKPSFVGDWKMDQERSFGLPPNQRQALKVSQAGDQIDFEIKLINPDGESTIKDSYIIDGKERDFVPQGPAGPVPNAKGKRSGNWLPNGRGIAVDEQTTTETPKGPVTNKVTRRWTISPEGELVIDNYVDTATVSYETKRIFKKQ
ncbi:MAG TPA: hypothetical protein VN643_05295 [Pyrinomonadaceae bacterium]|nr:hypothetical protein [Pyrinomonadaceae bacterium]